MLLLLAGFSAIALPWGWRQGLLRFSPGATTATTAGWIVGRTWVMPSLLEESLFRVVLLPHPAEGAPPIACLGWALGSLVLFVAAHPLQARLCAPQAKSTFNSATFLGLAGLLGLACTVSYYQSGSVWPPVVLHWGVVVVWLLLCDGYRRISP